MMTSLSSERSRFTDLNEELVSQIPTSISGYENKIVESLEESVKPVEHYFENLQANVFVAKQNSEELKEGLKQNQSASIRLYTMNFSHGESLYQVLNKTLQSENRQDLKMVLLHISGTHTL
jgi:hypothetical protein